jgi:hypothetical protein
MDKKKIIWMDDQINDFVPYLNEIAKAGYLVDTVQSVSSLIEKLRKTLYYCIICDIKVLPGDDQEWIKLDRDKRSENPDFDSYLGLELMYSLFQPEKSKINISPALNVDPNRIIVFSVVYDRIDEISSFGIPGNHIVSKSSSDLNTLPNLLNQIQNRIGD